MMAEKKTGAARRRTRGAHSRGRAPHLTRRVSKPLPLPCKQINLSPTLAHTLLCSLKADRGRKPAAHPGQATESWETVLPIRTERQLDARCRIAVPNEFRKNLRFFCRHKPCGCAQQLRWSLSGVSKMGEGFFKKTGELPFSVSNPCCAIRFFARLGSCPR